MGRRYFKIIEIDCDSFIDVAGTDPDFAQYAVPTDDAVYVSVENDKEEISVELDLFDDRRRNNCVVTD